jgi:hypothetical protein
MAGWPTAGGDSAYSRSGRDGACDPARASFTLSCERTLLACQPFGTHGPDRLAREPQHIQQFLHCPNEAGLDRASEREVEESLGLGARRRRMPRSLERATQCVGLFEECSHALDECVGARRPIIVCGGQNGTRWLGRPFTGWVAETINRIAAVYKAATSKPTLSPGDLLRSQ